MCPFLLCRWVKFQLPPQFYQKPITPVSPLAFSRYFLSMRNLEQTLEGRAVSSWAWGYLTWNHFFHQYTVHVTALLTLNFNFLKLQQLFHSQQVITMPKKTKNSRTARPLIRGGSSGRGSGRDTIPSVQEQVDIPVGSSSLKCYWEWSWAL
jgi:hypothetical protein